MKGVKEPFYFDIWELRLEVATWLDIPNATVHAVFQGLVLKLSTTELLDSSGSLNQVIQFLEVSKPIPKKVPLCLPYDNKKVQSLFPTCSRYLPVPPGY